MKKFLGLMLALVICACSLSSLAELGVDVSDDAISAGELQPITGLTIELKDESQAASGKDTVVNSNGAYTVITPSGMTILFDPRGLTYMTLTQDYYASYDIYSLFDGTTTAQEFINAMISGGYHIVVWDVYDAFDMITMDTIGSDDLTSYVGNLAYLGNEDINTVASALAEAVGVSSYSLYEFNKNVWIQLGDRDLFTIANGEWAHVKYSPKGSEMTKTDYADFTDFMRALKIL